MMTNEVGSKIVVFWVQAGSNLEVATYVFSISKLPQAPIYL